MDVNAVKQMLKSKGWTNVALAARWRVSTVWISQVINNPDRAPHYNDALCGLPKRLQERPSAKRAKRKSRRQQPRPVVKRKKSPGYRYHGLIERGDILAADRYFGSICEEGEHGIVVAVVDDGITERYRVLFPRGDVELLGPEHIDHFFYTNGQVNEFAKQYAYISDAQLKRDLLYFQSAS